MLVYRDQKSEVSVRKEMAALLRLAARGSADQDTATELLIRFGELETGIADSLEPNVDANGPVLSQLRQVALTTGRLFFSVWRETDSQSGMLQRLVEQIQKASGADLPAAVWVGVSEGYAYYALYPQMYLEATQRFANENQPRYATVIGIRNIGSSLSATVAGTLEELGVSVTLYTVRPHGHPFDRSLALAPALIQEWKKQSDGLFLLVDEGPGLSGSSLTSVAQALAQLNIADEKIIFFPSWEPDGSQFVSEQARRRWGKHKKFSTTFESVWIESGRQARYFPVGKTEDISSGKWRPLLLANPTTYPPVQPQHERRKFLIRQEDKAHSPLLVKFAGLGQYGRSVFERAQITAQAGFSPRPLALTNGFLITEFIEGHPLIQPSIRKDLLDRIAEYIAFAHNQFPRESHGSFDELVEMIEVNTREGLGDEWCARLSLQDFRDRVNAAGTTALDARMFPHEWLETSSGWVKTDGWEHQDDHFYPGPQNSAWDLASASVEFRMDRQAASYVIEHYSSLTKDQDAKDRVDFFKIAYLAFRLGYATMAGELLEETEDGNRFRQAELHYAGLLRTAIAASDK